MFYLKGILINSLGMFDSSFSDTEKKKKSEYLFTFSLPKLRSSLVSKYTKLSLLTRLSSRSFYSLNICCEGEKSLFLSRLYLPGLLQRS